MKIHVSAITDVGIERTNNEDAVIVCPDLEKQVWKDSCADYFVPTSKYGALFIVADGMGGANAGEVASSIAINSIKNYFSKEMMDKTSITKESACELLRDAIQLSNKAILNHIVVDPDSIGLGTTIVIAWIIDEMAYVAWCGDSRCYCFNPIDGLEQLTKDHSYVQELIDKGEISRKQAFNHPDSNIITRYLGDEETLPEVTVHKIKTGDVLLLCTDGLCGYCRDSLIEKMMYRDYGDVEQCKNDLVKIAMDAGGQDNISIVLCSVNSQNDAAFKVGLKGKIKRWLSKL